MNLFTVAMRLERFSSMTTSCWRTLPLESFKPMKHLLGWIVYDPQTRGSRWSFLTGKYLQTLKDRGLEGEMTAFEEFGVMPELGAAVDEMGWTLPTDVQVRLCGV